MSDASMLPREPEPAKALNELERRAVRRRAAYEQLTAREIGKRMTPPLSPLRVQRILRGDRRCRSEERSQLLRIVGLDEELQRAPAIVAGAEGPKDTAPRGDSPAPADQVAR